jgi:hypothetical protein
MIAALAIAASRSLPGDFLARLMASEYQDSG